MLHRLIFRFIYYLEVIFLNNLNFDKNTINNFKKMMENGDLSSVMSQIPPDVVQNLSSMMKNNSDNSKKNHESPETVSSNPNFNNIDINTIMKMKDIIDKMNSKNNAGMNLLNSLKPYLRNDRKEKLDQYANIMNFAQIAELLNNKSNNKENNGNE